MAKTLLKYAKMISNLLYVKEELVKEWIITNNHTKKQLDIIIKQIWTDGIYSPTLRQSIMDNTKYEISIY